MSGFSYGVCEDSIIILIINLKIDLFSELKEQILDIRLKTLVVSYWVMQIEINNDKCLKEGKRMV